MLNVSTCEQSALERADNFVRENRSTVNKQYRLRYHLMADSGWINDPNGFSYYKDQYHLFYQYNPYDSVWGPMHWGHSVSDDLVHCQTCTVALAPDESYDNFGCFSGTALVVGDRHILMYTAVSKYGKYGKIEILQQQCLATGDGESYVKHPDNPVIKTNMLPDNIVPEDVRDPKLFMQDGCFYCMAGMNVSDIFVLK